jgi:hypothetical protein
MKNAKVSEEQPGRNVLVVFGLFSPWVACWLIVYPIFPSLQFTPCRNVPIKIRGINHEQENKCPANSNHRQAEICHRLAVLTTSS